MPQADHGEPVFGAHPRFEDGLADEPRFGRQYDLDHADLLRPVAEIVPALAERPRLQGISLAQPVDFFPGGVHVDQQYVAGLNLRLRHGAEHLRGETRATLDREQVNAGGA